MVSVRARLLAFAPLVLLTLLTAAAAVGGSRTADGAPPVAAPSPSAPTPTSSATTAPPGPFVPVPPVKAVVPVVKPGSLGQARGAWDRALRALINAGSGKYSWAVYFSADPDPVQSESGGFDLDPFQSNFDRTVRLDSGREQVVHIRRIDQTSYMQLDHWGSWSGCWLRITNQQMEQQTGVDYSQSLPLPVGVLAITDAVISKPTGFWFGAPYREYGATVNAAEALQFLGLPATAIQKQFSRLSRIEVPITISLDSRGRLHGGGARGRQVALAIAKAAPGVLKDIVEQLPRYRAAFSLNGLGSPVSVPAPLPQSILPADAGRNETCAARGPRA